MHWLRKFMEGRNGADQFLFALLIIYWPFSLAGRLTGISIFDSLALACLIFAIFRFLSKNRARRQAENQQFLKLWQPFARWSGQYLRRVKEFKTHRYFKCPGCSQTLRLPAGKGKITIRCPKCDTTFDKRT